MARALLLVIGAAGFSEAAVAYVGPGAGLSLLGALWGLLVAIGAALLFLIMWPIRRIWKRRSQQAHPASDNEVPDQSSSTARMSEQSSEEEAGRGDL